MWPDGACWMFTWLEYWKAGWDLERTGSLGRRERERERLAINWFNLIVNLIVKKNRKPRLPGRQCQCRLAILGSRSSSRLSSGVLLFESILRPDFRCECSISTSSWWCSANIECRWRTELRSPECCWWSLCTRRSALASRGWSVAISEEYRWPWIWICPPHPELEIDRTVRSRSVCCLDLEWLVRMSFVWMTTERVINKKYQTAFYTPVFV